MKQGFKVWPSPAKWQHGLESQRKAGGWERTRARGEEEDAEQEGRCWREPAGPREAVSRDDTSVPIFFPYSP